MTIRTASKKLAACLAITLSIISCKQQDSTLLSETTAPDEIAVAIQKSIHPDVERIFRALSEGKALTLNQLLAGGKAMQTEVTAAVTFRIPTVGTQSRIRSRNRSKPNYNRDSELDTYRGLRLGDRVFVFKLQKQPTFSKVDSWTVLTWFGGDLLRDPVVGKFTSTQEQVRYVLDAKIYEPKSIARQRQMVESIDFAAHFIPGYAGAERLIYTGKSTGERVLGAVELVGDLATLGLGTKIRVVQKTAAVITISAASVRVGAAGYKAATGKADWRDGADAFLATVEAGLAAITLVKIKLAPGRAIVNSIDDAELIGKQLGRSADDVLQNGLSRSELESLVGDIPALRKLDDLDEGIAASRAQKADDGVPGNKVDDLDDGLPSKQQGGQAVDEVAAASLNPCKAFSLLNNSLCDLARLAPGERKGMRKAVESRSEALNTAKKEAGGYFGEMKEIPPRVTDKAGNGNIGYRELRGKVKEDGTPLYTREYWFKNADDQVVVIQEHSLGHPGLTNGELAHFNVRHVPNPDGSIDEILQALDKGSPPPNVPAVGHYDFAVVD